jgi:hypothetical protein
MVLMGVRRLGLAQTIVVALCLALASAPALAASPTIEGESFSDVGSSSATLQAQISAGGSLSSFHFEYGPTVAYGSSTPVEGLGSGSANVGVLARLSGLQPDAAYHFRVLATNELGTTTGADATFTTLPVGLLGLPDNRGYEMVSPVANADGNVYEPHIFEMNGYLGYAENSELPFQAAADGNAVAYPADPSTTGGTGSTGSSFGNEYLAMRAPGGGWTAGNIEPPSANGTEEPIYEAFSSDLSVGILFWTSKFPLTPGAPGGRYHILYARTSSDGSYHPFFTITPPSRGPEEFGSYEVFHSPTAQEGALVYAGASSNLEHTLFLANDALTPNATENPPTAEQNDLYDSVGGQLRLVNVLPNGTAEPNAIFGSPIEPPEPPTGNSPDFSHVISNDGSRIFWTDLNTGDLYVRENATTTVQVDAAVGGGGRFWTASADGSKAFFTKGGDLYEYNVDGGQTTDLTLGGEVQGVVGASEDGSYVYFAAKGALAPGATPQVCEPTEQTSTGCNLYVLHEGESPKLIAKLSGGDNFVRPMSFNESFGDWRPGLGNRTAEVTPDGRHLVFMSRQNITGYESQARQEVYVYDATLPVSSGNPVCASCNPSGEPPAQPYSAILSPSYSNTHMQRWISEDGSRVFFDSTEALVPQDTNGQARHTSCAQEGCAGLDVYEWERDGAGSCRRSGGCIYLLSSGTGTDNSYFADASANGNDVFIATRSQLTPQDQGNTFGMYDVRVDAPKPPSPPACAGSGCQGVPPAPPIFATPPSTTFNGVGNFPPPNIATTKPKALTNAQKLAKALKACRAKRNKRKRKSCEDQARSKYAPSKAKTSNRRAKR